MRIKANKIKQIVLFTILAALLFTVAGSTSALAANGDFTDQEIRNAVENELLFDRSVSLNNVDVEVSDGIVTVTGMVNNLLAKERAARLAETVKGVRSVVNQITVEPTIPRSDAEITTNIENAWLLDPATDSYKVSVTVEDGLAILSGTVQSWQEKNLAEKVAKGVAGVTDIDNQINIVYEVERPDPEIETEIEQALRWDVLVDHALIDVAVTDGNVTLAGTVGSSAEKRHATTNAWVTGVQSVDNTALTVERWARDEDLRQDKYVVTSDQEIEAAIEDALRIDPRTSAFDVVVDVDNGFVTLRGTVDNLKARRAAAQDARQTVGVASVTNRLKVRPVVTVTDEEIAADVRNALAWDPDVNRFDITVSVINGTVYLAGTVDSYFEKGQADDIASRINGATEVVNNLEVQNFESMVVYDPYVYDYYPYTNDWYDYQPYYTFTSDVEIEDDINDELWWSPFVDADEVTVAVANGVATLTGTVDTWSEYEAATENAYEGGATWVYNNLAVQ